MPTETQITFVLGTGRCGSTVLNDVMCLHPDTGFLSNYYNKFGIEPLGFAKAAYQKGGLYGNRRRGWPYPNEGYSALRRDASPMLVAPDRDLGVDDLTPYLQTRLRALFDGRARAHNVEHVTHKFTGWPRARLLAKVFPRAKFVHVIRDGRAVASSMLQQEWWSGFKGPEHWDFGRLRDVDRETYERLGGGFEVLAGLQWAILIRAFQAAASSVGAERWLTVRYEDVVARPLEEFERITVHAGLAWSTSFANTVSQVSFSTSHVDRYRADLGDRATRRVEEACGAALGELGYV